ncbi:MAG: XRE family transcriptional regulator, partial [Oscillospiraceae bacterium]
NGLSIAELSAACGVSTGLISQIERGMVVPSVVSLYRIAQALDTNINYFFEDPKAREFGILRRGDHKMITLHHGTSQYELLSPDKMEHAIDLTRITLKGGEVYERNETVVHEGEECGYVLSGVMTVLLDGEEYVLNPGDSMYFYSTLPHKYLNNGQEDCVSIWAMTPKFF